MKSLAKYSVIFFIIESKFVSNYGFESNEDEDEDAAEQDDYYTSPDLKWRLWGEPCNKTDNCDPEFWLSCVRGTCGCSSEQKSAFDPFEGPTKKFCIGLSGAKCDNKRKMSKSRKSRSLSSFFGIRFNRGSSNYFYKNMDCVDNAECDGHRCVCHADFYRNPNGSCLPKKGMYQRCVSNDECRRSDSLTCSQGKCRCLSPLIAERTSHGDRKCVVPANGKCNEIMSLIKDENGYTINDSDCVRNSDCSNGVCECNLNFRASVDLTCGGDYGTACGKGQPCSDIQFMCRDGTCQCRYSAHQYYDVERRLCLSLVSGPCSNPINVVPNTNGVGESKSGNNNRTKPFGGKCAPNSICTFNGYFNRCVCKNGYAEDSNGMCIKTFGASCERDHDCDPVSQLSCINGKCKCPDLLQIYDPTTRRCLALAGSRCSSGPGFGSNSISGRKSLMAIATGVTGTAYSLKDTPGHCIQNSSCQQSVKRIHGKCICIHGYEPTGNRTCRLITSISASKSTSTTLVIKAETTNSTFR